MPYPPGVSAVQIRAAKKFYAACQFGATSYSVFAPPDISFACVLAIEIASLLMTLVRKNKISSTSYHAVYSLCLAMLWPMTIRAALADDDCGSLHTVGALFVAVCAVSAASTLRLGLRWSKYTTWGVALPAGVLAGIVVPPGWKKMLMLIGIVLAMGEHWARVFGSTWGLLQGKIGIDDAQPAAPKHSKGGKHVPGKGASRPFVRANEHVDERQPPLQAPEEDAMPIA